MKKTHIEILIIRALIVFSLNLAVIIALLLYSVYQEKNIGQDNMKIAARLNTLDHSIKTIAKVSDGYFSFITGAADGLNTYNKIKKEIKEVHTSLHKLEKVLGAEDKANVAEVDQTFKQIAKIGEKMAIAAISEENDTFKVERDKFLLANEKLTIKTNKMLSDLIDHIKHSSMKLNKDAGVQEKIAYFFALLALIVLIISAKILLKGVKTELSHQAEKLSKEKNELEKGLTKIVAQLNNNYQKLKTSVLDLDASTNALSSSSTHQASATEEAVAAMEEISSMVAQTNENSSHALKLANDAQKKVEQGQDVVQKLDAAMDDIHNSNNELSVIVNLINEITEKTKIINSIVVKTELLSFNASIEAARAAEYGKGFAVVAEEVGNLARLSGDSAKEIEYLLGESVLKVNEIVELIQSRVSIGQKRSQECVEVFKDINDLNNNLTNSVNSISTATNEQTKGVEQTTMAMNDISKATQENLKITQSTSKLSSSITDEINLLNASMEDLRIILENSKKNKIEIQEQENKKHGKQTKSSNSSASPAPSSDSQIGEISEDEFNPEDIAQRYNSNVGSSTQSPFNDSDFQ